MKRTERVGALIRILTESPNKIYSLQYFCDLFDAAKSSISEDIQSASQAIELTGSGCLETTPGSKGGVRFVPDISPEAVAALQADFAQQLSDPSRLLGGNFLYTSTVETKGIPLAFTVAHMLGIPLVVIRREAKISEGSTVSINYFSGSYDRLQKMSMAKRAITPGSKVLIIDDFMRGGGSIVGISEMIGEFNGSVVGVGVAIASLTPEKKKVHDYTCLVYLGDIHAEEKKITILPNDSIF